MVARIYASSQVAKDMKTIPCCCPLWEVVGTKGKFLDLGSEELEAGSMPNAASCMPLIA